MYELPLAKCSSAAPKSLRSPELRARRLAAVDEPHVAPLTEFVQRLRVQMGPDYQIPYFDPWDGGVQADTLYLLEAPGPKAVASGFVSRDNPDETAKNFHLLNVAAGIDRRRTVVWNIVPWYIGSEARIRPANARDLGAARPALVELARLLPRLRTTILVGGKAATACSQVAALLPMVHVASVPHPSPMFVNRAAGNRALLLSQLRAIADGLPHWSSAGIEG